MIWRVPRPSIAAPRLLAPLALALALAPLAGCGSHTEAQSGASVPPGCAAVVIKTLGRVIERVYHEGVRSQRTASATYLITSSSALRRAVEAHRPSAARAAGDALLHTGHLTNLQLIVGGRTFIDLGGPAITPLRGTLAGAHGEAIATYITSVWSDEGFLAELGGAVEGYGALRAGTRTLGPGSMQLGAHSLPDSGVLTRDGVAYRYTSFAGEAFPSGAIRIYVLRTLNTTRSLCRPNSEGTIVTVLHHIANQIYEEEIGAPAQRQLARVQADRPLLEAVLRRDPRATEAAIKALLNEHIVRLRVYGPGEELLGDVGGPYVLAPVHGTLRWNGRRIGGFVLSVQDDEGYEKLTKRLEGLDTLAYMNGQIVKNDLGPVAWSEVPVNGSFTYEGRRYRVFTEHLRAFPRGPLPIRVLVPEPYFAQPVS